VVSFAKGEPLASTREAAYQSVCAFRQTQSPVTSCLRSQHAMQDRDDDLSNGTLFSQDLPSSTPSVGTQFRVRVHCYRMANLL